MGAKAAGESGEGEREGEPRAATGAGNGESEELGGSAEDRPVDWVAEWATAADGACAAISVLRTRQTERQSKKPQARPIPSQTKVDDRSSPDGGGKSCEANGG